MSRNLKTAIVGIIVALAVGLAVNYGLISQQTADEIKAKTDEVLTNEQTPQPSEPPASTQQSAPAPNTSSQAPEQEAQTPSQPPASNGNQAPAQPAPAN